MMAQDGRCIQGGTAQEEEDDEYAYSRIDGAFYVPDGQYYSGLGGHTREDASDTDVVVRSWTTKEHIEPSADPGVLHREDPSFASGNSVPQSLSIDENGVMYLVGQFDWLKRDKRERVVVKDMVKAVFESTRSVCSMARQTIYSLKTIHEQGAGASFGCMVSCTEEMSRALSVLQWRPHLPRSDEKVRERWNELAAHLHTAAALVHWTMGRRSTAHTTSQRGIQEMIDLCRQVNAAVKSQLQGNTAPSFKVESVLYFAAAAGNAEDGSSGVVRWTVSTKNGPLMNKGQPIEGTTSATVALDSTSHRAISY